MVEKMKKYSFLIYYKTYNEFLESIRRAGVLHIVEKQKGVPDNAHELRKQLITAETLKETIRLLQRRIAEGVEPKPLDTSRDGMEALYAYEKLKLHEEKVKTQQQAIQREIDNMSVWGDFDLEILKKLEESGRQLKFFSCRERDFKPEWTERFNAVDVARMGAIVYFVTVTDISMEEEPDAEKMRLAERSLSQLQADLQENKDHIEEVEKQFDLMALEHLNDLKETHRQLCESIDLNKVNLQTEKMADEHLILLEGWVPEFKESELIRALEKQDVYYVGDLPDKNDKTAPIMLKNNKLARLFEPIGALYELPNYHELDLTPFFAPFFMLFFGICLGDAGYGLLILLATLLVRSKVKPALKPILSLASALGAATVLCGAITGTFFGIPLLEMEWAWLTSFKRYMIDTDNMFNVALMLGVVQILFGMFVRAFATVRRFGWAYSLERWGWLILFIGGGSMYLAFFGKEAPPSDIVRYLFYAVLGISALFIFILNDPKRNLLVNFGAGLWNTFNMATGLLGDVLSYIRLFALGLCGAVMGSVFNQLALQLSGDIPVLSHIFMVLILLFGHSLNIFMSCLGAFVHPMRLTFVEFYKNSGFEGGGKQYKPFRYISTES